MKKSGFKLKLFLILPVLLLLFVSCEKKVKKENSLNLLISPYQDLAMIVNVKPLKLEKKYNLKVNITTVPWQNIMPLLSGYNSRFNVGFASYGEYLTKYDNINKGAEDKLVFVFPVYIFKGGAFVTFKNDIPPIFNNGKIDENAVKIFLGKKIGLQKQTIYEMLVFKLAKTAGIDKKSLKIYDVPMADAILAAQHGDIDIAAVGLTQLTEAIKRGGKSLLIMDDIGFSDITGLVCKESYLKNHREDLIKLIKMWYECTNFVFSDIEHNSKYSLDYLRKNASTKYTVESYKKALSFEYFPLSYNEAYNSIIKEGSKYDYKRLYKDMTDFLIEEKIIKKRPPLPQFIKLK
ncbi:hypothetical protein TTHT_1037 [Thermotomaculum hydrothermale]|uniref:SsuA/THI5-like domain-containing protein n=1 Tax=Thermotomaculum hydrothermale TaxID=981385 RepID=A0A7R6PQN6_9BACT|nr:ABC transporter substrate-binding protein [Thermotomaculum hydrothermale]BBB32576.1 hypothetical protein TTHT_1037 [Thermotomaculum hydrothermale]